MQLYPAIDLLEGRVVRLHKGDFGAATDYGDDPLAVASAYLAQGAEQLHAVDLSGARAGSVRQATAIKALCDAGLQLQVGGGIRTGEDIATLLDAGASRVIVGSMAVLDPSTVTQWLSEFGCERIVAAFDIRVEAGVAWPLVAGWTQKSEMPLAELLQKYQRSGLRHGLVTDVDRDGTLEGPNSAFYETLCARWPEIDWQASGGVSSLEDLVALRTTGVAGAIIGKALFENRFTFSEALSCLRSA